MNTITYILSEFLTGSVSDHSNAYVFLSLGLVLAVVPMMFMIVPVQFFGPEQKSLVIIVMTVLDSLAGWSDGVGWPPCRRVTTHWLSVTERGTMMSVWNCARSVGSTLVDPMAVYGTLWFGSWFCGVDPSCYFLIGTYVFSAVVIIFVALATYCLIRDTP